MLKKLFLVLIVLISGAEFVKCQTTFQIENNSLVLPSTIVFETGSDKIKPESETALNHVLAYLTEKTYITLLRVEGHVFNAGNEQKNQLLSEKRAFAVCKWLINKGIDCKRLLAVGFGSNKPIVDNSTPAGKLQNTRIAFVNAQLRGRSIGGFPIDGGGLIAPDPCK